MEDRALEITQSEKQEEKKESGQSETSADGCPLAILSSPKHVLGGAASMCSS